MKRSRKRRHRSRARRRNPGMTLRRPLRAVTAGFSINAVKDTLPVAVGAFGNFIARQQVAKLLPMTAAGLPSYAAGIATAGLMLMVPKYGGKLFIGGMTETLLRAFNQYISPGLTMLRGLADDGYYDGYDGSGLDDYEQTLRDYQVAGMLDYETAGMSDYETAGSSDDVEADIGI